MVFVLFGPNSGFCPWSLSFRQCCCTYRTPQFLLAPDAAAWAVAHLLCLSKRFKMKMAVNEIRCSGLQRGPSKSSAVDHLAEYLIWSKAMSAATQTHALRAMLVLVIRRPILKSLMRHDDCKWLAQDLGSSPSQSLQDLLAPSFSRSFSAARRHTRRITLEDLLDHQTKPADHAAHQGLTEHELQVIAPVGQQQQVPQIFLLIFQKPCSLQCLSASNSLHVRSKVCQPSLLQRVEPQSHA